MRDRFTIVLAEAVEREVQRAIATKTAKFDASAASMIIQSVAGWFNRVRIERHRLPSAEDVRSQIPVVPPALRHVNDLPAIVTAVRARPDWVISSNLEHWNETLSAFALVCES